MTQVLDHILKKDIFDTTTINSNFESEAFEIDRAEGGYAVTITLSAGNGSVNMDFYLKMSTDGISYPTVTDSIQTFIDDDGSITFDILDTNLVFAKICSTHTDGTIDISGSFTAQRRH